MKMSRFSHGMAWLPMALLGFAAGCQSPRAPVPEGQSTFRFLEPPAPPSPPRIGTPSEQLQPRVILVEAKPRKPLATPIFPAAALGRHAAIASVAVRITVDTDGRVSAVGPSMLAISTPGPFAHEFRGAVEDAVRQWRFTPAEIRHLEPAKEEGKTVNYWNVTSSEKVEASFDVAFTFTATGDVMPAAPRGQTSR